ncbi:hypothetical protein RvY_05969 [Ramazzottius varieornatus]|uniref:Uncharacterized protein n=1 Tax=Ramazzottius varieornatus TaxID=947166 RepID=A0A1D1V5S2_RAMVA|nr:hypothetical protein RvY_05969 [Ramazzottius varieornatus]
MFRFVDRRVVVGEQAVVQVTVELLEKTTENGKDTGLFDVMTGRGFFTSVLSTGGFAVLVVKARPVALRGPATPGITLLPVQLICTCAELCSFVFGFSTNT